MLFCSPQRRTRFAICRHFTRAAEAPIRSCSAETRRILANRPFCSVALVVATPVLLPHPAPSPSTSHPGLPVVLCSCCNASSIQWLGQHQSARLGQHRRLGLRELILCERTLCSERSEALEMVHQLAANLTHLVDTIVTLLHRETPQPTNTHPAAHARVPAAPCRVDQARKRRVQALGSYTFPTTTQHTAWSFLQLHSSQSLSTLPLPAPNLPLLCCCLPASLHSATACSLPHSTLPLPSPRLPPPRPSPTALAAFRTHLLRLHHCSWRLACFVGRPRRRRRTGSSSRRVWR